MLTIPLHSLVITIGTSKLKEAEILSYFDDYEIVNREKINQHLFGCSEIRNNHEMINHEMYRLIQMKIFNGERVVLSGSNISKSKRTNISYIGRKFNIPVFYVLTNDDSIIMDRKKLEIYRNNENDILDGDGFAKVLDLKYNKINVVKKLDNTLDDIKNRGFKGITIAADIHGNLNALERSIEWAVSRNNFYIQLGDLIDYGKKSLECIEMMYNIVVCGKGCSVIGNHERKLEKWFHQEKMSRNNPEYFKFKSPINLSESNIETIRRINSLGYERKIFESKFNTLMNLARNHYNIGNLTVSHASFRKEMLDINSSRLYGAMESYAIFGDTTYDPINKNYTKSYQWINDIPEDHIAIVGHDILSKIRATTTINHNNGIAVFLDTGCSKGGKLTTVDIKFDDKLKIENYNWF